ncbi:TetR/AcrR family transcriptional regulator [Mycolicibacterium aurum]|uniref:TetR/AcrR family transcriptional regulator n=1 Tax=Mycolicibacterium aurum TaxID=1791 RepID=UPI0014773D60|nr:TetR/AcrR family transcriptional regulator [Mycolicibacterium aurum]
MSAAVTLAADGYDAVQLRLVAEDAGVSTSTIYHYFSSKDDLLVACFHRWIVANDLAIRAELAPIADPTERLRRVIYRMTESLCAATPFAQAVCRAYLCADHTAAANTDHVREALSMVFSGLDRSDISPRLQQDIGSLFGDCWVINALSVIHGRATVAELQDRLARTAADLMTSRLSPTT